MSRPLRAALAGVFFCLTLLAKAQTVDEAASRGLVWLAAQVQPSGHLVNEATSMANAIQARSEAAVALRLLAQLPSPLAQLLAADSDQATELVARSAIALLVDGRDAASHMAVLTARQNSDGGFGTAALHESTVLDTAWATLALAHAGQGTSVAAARARAFIVSNLMADGGLRGQDDLHRLYNNAVGLLALQTTSDGSTSSAVSAVSNWLRQMQPVDGGWGGEVGLSATVLLAVASGTADSTVIGLARNHLVSAQAADGSWGQDPYLTALAIRALLARGSTTPSAPLLATIKGVVVDRGTNSPLTGVVVALSGAVVQQTTTDAQGRFSLNSLASGGYGIQFGLPGYASSSGSVTLAAGQIADLGLIQLAQTDTTGVVRGVVSDAGTSQPLAGVDISLSGSMTASAQTGTDGSFEIADVLPGSVTITASHAGYQNASGTATMSGGQTLLFHPKLYRTGDATPTQGRVTGHVVDASSGLALSGVSVTINGAALAQTGADGRFDVMLAAGAYDVEYSLPGHDSARQQFLLSAGSVVDAGTIALLEQRTTTTVRGTVRDGAGRPIENAAVRVIDGPSATTGADGAYVLIDMPGTAFDLRVSATGYNSLSARLQLARPADVVQDFALTTQATSLVALGALNVAPPVASADTEIAVATEIVNDGAETAAVVATLQVFDSAGNFAGKGAAYDPGGVALSTIELAPGERRSVVLRWNTARFAPGGYQLRAHLVEPGTFSAANPNGSIMVERAAGLTVTGMTRFIGSVTADPPVLRAGLNQAMALSATLRNDGNTAIDAQAYTLQLTNTQTNAIVATRTAQGDAMPLSAVQTLSFASWTPDVGGDFRMELRSADPAQGLATGRAYVGDAARATYTVDRLFVPAGNQVVKATIHIEGQDVTSGSISDPLAPLIRTAVKKAVEYTDREGAAWTSRNQCLGCHIQTHGLFGGETNRRYVTDFNASQRNTLFNINTSRQRSNGAFYNPEHSGYRDSITRLSAWALSAWHDAGEAAAVRVRSANYLMTRQQSNGGWNPDYTSPATGEAAIDHTPFIIESLIRLRQDLPALETGGVGLLQVSSHLPAFAQIGTGMLARDASGNLYFAIHNAGRVVQLRADGSVVDQWNGLPAVVWAGVAAPDGNGLWVATSGGIRRLVPGGIVQAVNGDGFLSFITTAPDGSVWAAGYSTNSIYRVAADGSAQTWLQSSQLNGPAGMAFDSDGGLLVLSQLSRTILRVAPDKSVTTLVPAPIISAPPNRIVRHQDKWWVSTSESVLRFNDDWRVEREDTARIDDLVALGDGSLLAAGWQFGGIRRISVQDVDLSELRSRLDTSIDRGTTWLTNLNLGATADNRQLAHHLLGLGEAAKFYPSSARATTIRGKMQAIGDLLKSRQRSDGGWGRYVGWGSDSYVTAKIGYALDYLDPSPSDPYIRKAVTWLLSRQQADGSWASENGIFGTRLGATNWVSIWLPVMLDRLGGIDTDLTVAFPGNVTVSAPSIAPVSIAPAPDGGTAYRWSLVGVTNEGRDISFDLALANMAVGEVRQVSTEAKLTFTNTFTNQPQDAPIDIPAVSGSAFLALGVGTDQAAYGADMPVTIGAQVINTGANLASGSVQLEVFAPDNTRIADLGRLPFSGVASAAAVNLQAVWNTGTYAAGTGYSVKGTLFDASNAQAGTATVLFDIQSAPSGSPALSGSITTDRITYAQSDAVIVTDRIRNLTANLVLEGLQAVTTVTDAGGRVVFLRTETLGQLLAGSVRDLPYRVTLVGAPVGRFRATLGVLDGAGALLANAATEFDVQSIGTGGQGVKGTISASPKSVKVGTAGTFVYTATNDGSAALSGVPLIVRVLDPTRSLTLHETVTNVDLGVGSSHSGSSVWSVGAPVGSSLVAALYARVDGVDRLLAQDGFRVIEEPFKVEIGAEPIEAGRVLVLVSCPLNADGTGSDRAECVAARTGFIDSYLTGLELSHTITSDVAQFARELRSGGYGIYWITGGANKLDHVLAGEVRQAVQRGEALVMDGIHDERNRLLDDVIGIKFIGKYNEADLPIKVGSERLPAATLGTRGVPLRLQLSGGETDAVYSDYPSRPAMVTRDYGEGAAVLFTFDWVGTLMALGNEWKATAGAAFEWVSPLPSDSVTEGALVAVRFSVANVGAAGRVAATLAMPAGFAFVDARPAAVVGDDVSWSFDLATGATQEITVWLRAPGSGGSYDLTLSAAPGVGDTTSRFTGTAALEVTGLDQLADEAMAAIHAIAPTNSSDRQARDRAAADVERALVESAAGQHLSAIASLVDAETELQRISTADVGVALVAVARLQQVTERRASP